MSEVKEVTAWAVVTKSGFIYISDMFYDQDVALEEAEQADKMLKAQSPHRVIRVRIVPDTEEQK